MGKTLYLFTKTFPFGHGEQYLAQELPILASNFEKIILVPCSIFDKNPKRGYDIPGNCDVFLINTNLEKKSLVDRIRNFFFIVGLTCTTALHNHDGSFFYKNLGRSISILRQQLACAVAMESYLKKNKADISKSVFYSYWVYNSCIILGILKGRGVINKFVARAHAYDLYHRDFFPEQADKSPLPWERFKFEMTDLVYCISTHGADFLKKRYPQWANKFLVSRLGVETPTSVNPVAMEGEKFRIVTCSTVQSRKRVDLVPEIMSHLDFPLEWVHFGTGEAEDVKILEAAWEKFKRPQHNFDFKGYTLNPEIKAFYANRHIDLFLNLSLAEGVPVALMEAAAYGIPMLATDVYANSEVAKPGCGFIVPKHFNAEEVARQIEKLRGDKSLQQKMSVAARAMQAEEYDAMKNFRQFSNELKAL